jgi:hypothetical protein
MAEPFEQYPSLAKRDDENAAQYQAFIDYISLGWDRSLDKLRAQYIDALKEHQKVPTKQRRTLGEWSMRYEWQKRLGQWREEVAAQTIRHQEEYLQDNIAWQLKMHAKLRAQIESMVARFDELRITRKATVDDPRNPGQKMEVVHQRVNVRDLETLVKTYSELGEKLRRQLGLKESISLEIPGVKAYIGFSPEEWDAENPPEGD